MNILFISHIWPPSIDGGSQIIANTQKYLANKHNTLVLSTNCTSTDDFVNTKSKLISKKDTDIFRLPVFKTKLFLYLYKLSKINLLKVFATGPIFKPIPFIITITKIIKFKPNLIIAGPFPTTIVPISIFLKKITRSRLLVLPCFHQYDPSFQNPFLVNCLKHADYIWTLTNHERKYLKNILKQKLPKIFSLYPGISNIFLRSPLKTKNHSSINLLFLGNLAAHKNINLLLSAFKTINIKYPKTRLTIVGQQTLFYPQIKKHLKGLPLSIRKI